MYVTTRLAVCLVLAATLAGCSSGSSGVHGEHTNPAATAPPSLQAAANHLAAEHEATRLLSLVRLPSGARRISAVPAHLDSALGTPAASSLIDDKRFWSIPMSYDDTVAWFTAHPPQGNVKSDGSGTGSGPGYQTHGVEYAAPANPAFQSATLSINIGTDSARRSFMRADAQVVWLDPRPIRDTATGRRIHFTVAQGCPSNDRGVPDVTNRGPGLDTALLPNQNPTRALLCRYAGLNGHRFRLIGHQLLGSREASRDAMLVRSLPLSHVDDAVHSCPADDASAGYAAFEYADGFTVDLKVGIFGCASVSNGVILTTAGTLPRLFAKLGPKTPF